MYHQEQTNFPVHPVGVDHIHVDAALQRGELQTQQEQVSQEARTKPRVFYGWFIVSAGMGMHLWVSICWVYGMQVFFTPIVQHFGWSRAIVSGAFGLQRLEGSIVAPIEGFLVDKYGPRKMMLAGAIIMGLSIMYLSIVNSIFMFYVAVLMVSLGTSATGSPRNWAIVQWFRRQRGRAMGIGASGAILSGPMLFVVVWLIESFGWRTAFVVLGLATWCIMIPLSLVFRARPHQYGMHPDGDTPEEAEAAAAATPRRSSMEQLSDEESLTVMQALRTPAFWILSIIFGAETMGVSGLIVHLIPYLLSIEFSNTQAATVLAFFTVLSVFGRLGGGWIMDYISARLVLAGLLGIFVTAFVLLANMSGFHYWQVITFALLYGTAFGGMIPARGVLVSNYFGPRNFGALQGLTRSVTVVSGMMGPIMMGFVFDLTDSYVISLYVLAAVCAVAIPLAVIAKPPSNA